MKATDALTASPVIAILILIGESRDHVESGTSELLVALDVG